MLQQQKKPYKKIAFALSLCALIVWGVLGTGASLAWFTDTSAEVKNIINLAEFEAEVLFKDKTGNYVSIDGRTDIFDNEALYEPGYTQVVYLKVNNNGNIAFNYQTAVIIDSFVSGTNVFGKPLKLQDYLKFGLVTAESESALTEMLSTREKAQAFATKPLNRYDAYDSLEAGKTDFMAIVLYMPKDIDNDANYRGLPIPEVKLGISVNATQQ